MPKSVSKDKTKKAAGKPVVIKERPAVNGRLNGRLNAMVGLVQAVENRTYQNKLAAIKARNLMNAVGVILQELPTLLAAVEGNKDGYSYRLYDVGKGRSRIWGCFPEYSNRGELTEVIRRGGPLDADLITSCFRLETAGTDSTCFQTSRVRQQGWVQTSRPNNTSRVHGAGARRRVTKIVYVFSSYHVVLEDGLVFRPCMATPSLAFCLMPREMRPLMYIRNKSVALCMGSSKALYELATCTYVRNKHVTTGLCYSWRIGNRPEGQVRNGKGHCGSANRSPRGGLVQARGRGVSEGPEYSRGGARGGLREEGGGNAGSVSWQVRAWASAQGKFSSEDSAASSKNFKQGCKASGGRMGESRALNDFMDKVTAIIKEAADDGLDFDVLKREVTRWGQGDPLAEGSSTQRKLRELIEELAAVGMMELRRDMAEGKLPEAAAAWNEEMEAEADGVLVDRISTGIWKTLFLLYKGIPCYYQCLGPLVSQPNKFQAGGELRGVQGGIYAKVKDGHGSTGQGWWYSRNHKITVEAACRRGRSGRPGLPEPGGVQGVHSSKPAAVGKGPGQRRMAGLARVRRRDQGNERTLREGPETPRWEALTCLVCNKSFLKTITAFVLGRGESRAGRCFVLTFERLPQGRVARAARRAPEN